MTLKVDKGIQMPSRSQYPWDEMTVGDSFFSENAIAVVTTAAGSRSRKNPGEKYSCRTVTENGVTGTRCWRVA